MRAALLILFLFIPACASSNQLSPVTSHVLTIEKVNVVDVREGRVVPNQTVVVVDGRIAYVGPFSETPLPSMGRVVNGADKYLIPGLWDMHAHTSADRVSRQIVLPLYVANGVTGIRSMAADCFEDGGDLCSYILAPIETTNAWRKEIAEGTLIGPRIIAGSAKVHGPRPGEASTVLNPGTAEDARAHARLLNRRGVDFIKIYDELSREAYFALIDEANQLGLPAAGHVPVTVRASEASDAGQKSIEHCCAGSLYEQCSEREDELRPIVITELASESPAMLPIMLLMIESFSEEKCSVLYDKMVDNGTWFVPTLLVAKSHSDWQDDPRTRFLPPSELRYWKKAHKFYKQLFGTAEEREPVIRQNYRLTKAMHQAGVRMLAGSDAGEVGIFFGSALSEELQLLVEAGLTEAEALWAATLGPAEYLGMTDDLGTVEVGKIADLVLLNSNPLADIHNTQDIQMVVLNGRPLDHDALKKLLLQIEEAAQSFD